MRKDYQRFHINDAFKIKWVNSGVTPTSLQSRIYDAQETVVHSADMVSSGSGHYYQLTYVETPGVYVAETYAVVAGSPYTNRVPFRAVKYEVD